MGHCDHAIFTHRKTASPNWGGADRPDSNSYNLDLFVVSQENGAIAENGWCSMFWRLVAFLGLSLINPLCMALSFCVCMGMDVYRPTSTNVVTFDARFFPVYLTIGMLAILLQLLLVYGIARLAYRGRRVTVAKVARAFLSAQKPFLFLVLALPLLLGDVEGNVLAFGAIFAFPFVVVAGVFAVLSLFRKLKATADEPSDEGVVLMATVAGATAIAVCASLLVIWTYGQVNGFGEWLAWRSDTPQYAIRRIIEAAQTGDVAKLEPYADLDAILAQFAVVGGPTRAGLLDVLATRQRNREAQTGIRYEEWNVGAHDNGDDTAANPVQLRECDGTFTVTITPQSEVTGESCSLIFAIEPTGHQYRVTRVTNMEDIADFLKKQQERARKLPVLAKEAKAKAQSLADVRLHSLRGEGESLRWECDVVNKGATTIALLECAVILRRVDTGAVALAEVVYLNFDPDGLSAGHATRIEASTDVSSVVARNVEAGRLVVVDVVPVAVIYADKRLDLVQLPD